LKSQNVPLGVHVPQFGNPWFTVSACFAYDKAVINQRRFEKSAFKNQSEKNSV